MTYKVTVTIDMERDNQLLKRTVQSDSWDDDDEPTVCESLGIVLARALTHALTYRTWIPKTLTELRRTIDQFMEADSGHR